MIQKHIRKRWWLEVGGALFSSILAVATLVTHEWIEIVFGVDPDGGSGIWEWAIVLASVSMTVILSALARYEWRAAVANG